MMQKLIVLLVQLTAFVAYGQLNLNYRKEGQYIIGAILPLTSPDANGKCTDINPKGVAIAEAIGMAINRINLKEDGFKDLVQKTPFGYDIRDDCGKESNTVQIAYQMASEKIAYQRQETNQIPVSVVISSFDMTVANRVLPGLSGLEIAQFSYSKDNARLKNDGSVDDDKLKQLVSMFPGSNKKIAAVIDIIKKYQFSYVHGVATNNVEGKNSLKLLADGLDAAGVCKSDDMLMDSEDDIKGILDQIAKNDRIDVVVMHTTKDLETAFYREATKQNMTDLVIISTQNWDGELDALEAYSEILEGMIYLQVERTDDFMDLQFKGKSLPYAGSPWLKDLFKENKGNDSCFKNNAKTLCGAVEAAVVKEILEFESTAVYAFEAVYAVAYALQKSKDAKVSLIDAAKGMKVYISVLGTKNIIIGEHLATEISLFKLINVQKRAGNLDGLKFGNWNNDPNVAGGPLYILMNKPVLWKDGEKEIPVSVCSASCAPGYKRDFLSKDRKCCWTCSKCPNETASNISDSDSCVTCPDGYVVKPNQDGCAKYKLLYFDWYGVVGIILIILIVVSIALIVFALVIFSNNNMHELVIHANYNSLTVYLLALILLVISPIPLLIQPTVSSCFAYIILVNVGNAIVIGVLISRSAYINNFFDDNGELVKGSLGPFPRPLVVLLVFILQIIVSIVAYNMETLLVMHNKTEKWDERYHECSSWASVTFWAGFAFNIVASVVGNSMSCSSVKVEDDHAELKHVLQCHLVFYIVALTELCVFFRSNDHHLAGGQGVCCILYALGFFVCYIGPKLYIILFRSKGNKAIEDDPDDDKEALMTTAVHASAGFKHHGIVQMTIRDDN